MKKQYDKFAKEYFKLRFDKKDFNHNRLIETPCIIRTVGNVRNKVILDLGCGFGEHASKYLRKGAKKVIGIDISKELIKIAKSRNINKAEFYVADFSKKLKFKSNSFDIVTASLCVYYIKNLNKLFKEVNRILKKNGLFVFSMANPVFYSGVSEFNKEDFKFRKLLGHKTLKSGKRVYWGNYFDESCRVGKLTKNIKIKFYKYTYETYIKTLIKNDLEIIDYVDCKPVKEAKKVDKGEYERCMRLPTFCIFKARKK